VVEGYFVHDKLKQDFPNEIGSGKNIDQGLKAVAEGEAAAYVDNSASIIYAIRKLGLKDLKVAATTPLQFQSLFRCTQGLATAGHHPGQGAPVHPRNRT